jgi:hypothetical protein
MNKIIEIPVSQIEPDPDVPQFRGPIHNTVALQASIHEDGIQNPLWVREWAVLPEPEDEDSLWYGYYLIDGNRRFHAARQLGLDTVPCIIKDVEAAGARRLAMVSNQSKEWPHIVLAGTGDVIGGNCLAVKLEIDRSKEERKKNKDAPKVTRDVVGEWLGITSDVAGALYRLYDESVELKQLVEKEHISITVYSIFKTAPQEVKDYIVTRKMPITAGRVRTILKNWDEIRTELKSEEPADHEETEDKKDKKDKIEDIEEETVGLCLNNALNWLRRVNGHDLGPSDLWLIQEIDKTLEKYRNG